jgi:hypothetical protein
MRSSHAWKLFALLLLTGGYIGLYHLVPARHHVEPHWGDRGANWFGQEMPLPFLFAVALLTVLYGLRYVIIAKAVSPADALAWYALLLASLLPGVWLLVAWDWDNRAVAPIANWVGTPVMALFVPTAFLCFDVATATRPRPGWYAARSLLEVLVLTPAWVVCWAFIELGFLGWFYI